MIQLVLITLISAVLSLGGTNIPQTRAYPAIVKDSTERRAKAEREWRQMLDSYGVPQTPPDLHPIIWTPRSLLGVTGGIKIMNVPPEMPVDALTLREAMRSFIDRWRDLIGADPASVSLVSGDQSDNIQRLTYRQANYAYPVAGNAGEMTAVVSKDGRLLQLDDRFIPRVDLPTAPTVEREAAARRLKGRTFVYTDLAGREQRATIGGIDEIAVKRLVVLSIEKGDAIEIHLAWEIIAGKQLSWTVYLDAISGEELRVAQNFQT